MFSLFNCYHQFSTFFIIFNQFLTLCSFKSLNLIWYQEKVLRANTQDISLGTTYGGQSTFLTRLVKTKCILQSLEVNKRTVEGYLYSIFDQKMGPLLSPHSKNYLHLQGRDSRVLEQLNSRSKFIQIIF